MVTGGRKRPGVKRPYPHTVAILLIVSFRRGLRRKSVSCGTDDTCCTTWLYRGRAMLYVNTVIVTDAPLL